jgi:hypothetical protein
LKGIKFRFKVKERDKEKVYLEKTMNEQKVIMRDNEAKKWYL